MSSQIAKFPRIPKVKKPKNKNTTILKLSEILHDGKLWSPGQMFNDAVIQSATEYPEITKAMAIFYNPTAESIHYSQSGMSLTEMIRMLSRLHDELIFDLIKANL